MKDFEEELYVLDLSNNDLDSDSCLALSLLIELCPFLREINLSNNLISTDGLNLICSSLAQNQTVKKLDIRDNHIPDYALKAILALLL